MIKSEIIKVHLHFILNRYNLFVDIEAQDNPSIVLPENCRYDTCLIISDQSTITDNSIRDGSIPGGKYAVFKIEQTVEAIQKPWLEI